MKFSCKQLHDAIKICQKTIKRNAILPITDGVYLLAEKDSATMVATNLETWIVVTFKIQKTKARLEVVLNPSIISTLANKKEVDITIKDGIVNFKFDGNAVANMKADDAGYFPALPINPMTKIFSDQDHVVEYMKELTNYTTSDEMRPAMTGINFKRKDERVQLIASDGHVLSVITTSKTKHTFDFVVPVGFVKLLSQFVSKKGCMFNFSYSESHVECEFIHNDFDITIIGRLIKQQYPNFMAVIPFDANKQFIIKDKNAFKKELLIADKWANETTHQITIDLANKTLQAKNMDHDSGYAVELDAETKELEGTEQAAFNCRFLHKIIGSTISKNEIVFKFNAVTKPFIIQEQDELHERLLLIMPVIIYN